MVVRVVKGQKAQLAPMTVAEHAVLVYPLLGKADNGYQIGRHGGDGIPAFNQPPQPGGIIVRDSGIAGLGAVRRSGLGEY
jgi:hypothetical protein